MGKFFQYTLDFDWHGSARQPGNKRRAGRQYENVRANSGGSGAIILQHSKREAHDQENQRYLKRHRYNAYERAERPMHQVADNHAIHHSLFFLGV
jgi:hypothetical protein